MDGDGQKQDGALVLRGTQIMSVFPDGLRSGAGAELIIGMHKTRAKLIARVTCH